MKESKTDSHEALQMLNETAGNSSENLKSLQDRFDLNLSLLKSGRAFVMDSEPDHLALDTLEWLAKLLRSGCPNKTTLNLIASYFEAVSATASNSETAWKKGVDVAKQLLAYGESGRPDATLNELRAIETYRIRTELYGDSVEDAAVAAYNAYFHSSGRNFASDDKALVNVTKGTNFLASTVARRSMENTIHKLLRREKLIKPKSPGRRRKN